MGRNTANTSVKIAILLLVITMLSACSSISVSSDWDPGVDFSKFKTFAMLEDQGQSLSRLVNQRIQTTLIKELTSRGLRMVESPKKADLAIGYEVTTEERTTYHTVQQGWSSHGYRSSRHWGTSLAHSTTTPVNFTVGTLIIAMFQTTGKELVWEGSGSGTIRATSSPEQSEQRITEAVQRILRDFPPAMKPAT